MINEQELEQLRKDLSIGMALNFTQLGRVFGEEFWQLQVIAMSPTRNNRVRIDNVEVECQQFAEFIIMCCAAWPNRFDLMNIQEIEKQVRG